MTDQELDRLLYAHAGAARDLVLAQLPPEGELPDIPTSPRFQRRMKALIRRADRPGWAKAALRCARQAAVILLVCGTLTFSGLMVTSQAFRAQVLEVLTQITEDFSYFFFSAESTTSSSAGDFVLTYLPDGVQETGREGDDIQLHLFFESSAGDQFRLTHSVINPESVNTYALDTEDAEVEYFWIGSHEAIAVSKKSNQTIAWTTENSFFVLSGTIPMEELKQVALGLEPIS